MYLPTVLHCAIVIKVTYADTDIAGNTDLLQMLRNNITPSSSPKKGSKLAMASNNAVPDNEDKLPASKDEMAKYIIFKLK
jgi:hypothetical protein